MGDGVLSSEDEGEGASPTAASDEDEDGEDGPFAFRRQKHCAYHAPLTQGLGNWPWCSREDGGLADRRFRFCLTSLGPTSAPTSGSGRRPQRRCVGFARRRVGRGGRVILDRVATPLDDLFEALDFTILDSSKHKTTGQELVKPEFFSQPRPEVKTNPREEDPDVDQDALIREIRSEWLHFRPATPPPSPPSPPPAPTEHPVEPWSWWASGPGELRLQMEPSEGACVGEVADLSLTELLAGTGAAEERGPDVDPAAAARMLGFDAAASVAAEDALETEESLAVGCSSFRIHSPMFSHLPSPLPLPTPLTLQTSSGSGSSGALPTAGLSAPGPGRPPPSATRIPSPLQPQHRKRHRHHSGAQGALSNGVGVVPPAAVSALLASGSTGLLLGGISNGPTTATATSGARRGATASGTLTALPALLVKQEIKQEPGDDSSYSSEYDFGGSGSGMSPVTDGSVALAGASPSGDASGACAEQQKLKGSSTTAQQPQLPMEVT